MEKTKIPFVKAVNYFSAVATGVTLTGPSQDGLMHFTFFKDAQLPVTQEYEVEQQKYGDIMATKIGSPGPVETTVFKEIVATISISKEQFTLTLNAMKKLQEFTEQHSGASPSADS